MRKQIAAKINKKGLDGNPAPKAEASRIKDRAYFHEFTKDLKIEAKRLGIPYSRFIKKEMSTFMSLETPSQAIPKKNVKVMAATAGIASNLQ